MQKQFYEYEPTGADRELERAERREDKLKAENATLHEQVKLLREACECGVMQLDITAAPIEDMADRIGSQSWRDIANGCRKQSAVISRAIEATKETT